MGSDKTPKDYRPGREQCDEGISRALREPLLSSQQETRDELLQHPTTWSSETGLPEPSRNVHLTLIYTIFAFAGRSMWSQSILATYVFLLKNDVEAVGYITAVLGMAQLVASIPAGITADFKSRRSILRMASILGALAIATTMTACLVKNYFWLVTALAAWGIFNGVTNTTLDALFTDSIPVGDRSHFFTQRASLVSLGNVVGPFVSLVMFLTLGNHWTVQDCTRVMAMGQLICLPSVIMLCFFKDSNMHENTNEHDTWTGTATLSCQSIHSAVSVQTISAPLDEESNPQADQDQPNELHRDDLQSHTYLQSLRDRHIPATIAIVDIISGLASGMSIRYFPIFFVDNLQLSPVFMQALYILSPLLMVVLMKVGQLLSIRWGRLHVTVLFKWIGVIFMFAMIGAYHRGGHPVLVCTLYVLRTAFMNSTGALSRSALMDHVPYNERGRWSALESVNMFSWSGSAAIGGILVQRMGLLPMFAVTAGLQWVGTWPMISLFQHDFMEQNTVSHSSVNMTRSNSVVSLLRDCDTSQDDDVEEDGDEG